MRTPRFLAALLLALLTIASLTACGDSPQPTSTDRPPAATEATRPTKAEAVTPATETAAATPADTRTDPTSPPQPPATALTASPQLRPTAEPTLTAAPRDPASTPLPTPLPTTPPRPNQPTAAPAPAATGGICGRHPSVQRAITQALAADSCSQVTEADLSTITSLHGISLESLPESETAGLTALETLSVTVSTFTYEFAHLPQLRDLELNIILPSKLITVGRERPGKLEIRRFSRASDQRDRDRADEGVIEHTEFPFGITHANPPPGIRVYSGEPVLHNLKITLDTGHPDNYLASGFNTFLALEYPTDNLHIVLRSAHALYGLRRAAFSQQYESFTLDLDPDPRYDIPNSHSTASTAHFGEERLNPRNITIRNLSPSLLNISEGFFGRFSSSYEGVHIKVRGTIHIDEDAFDNFYNIRTLQLDLNEHGEPHYLSTYTGSPPEGSGFTTER